MNPPEELMAMAGGHGHRPWPWAMAEGHGLGPQPKAMVEGHGLGLWLTKRTNIENTFEIR